MFATVKPTLKHIRWVRSSSSLYKKYHAERPIHEVSFIRVFQKYSLL